MRNTSLRLLLAGLLILVLLVAFLALMFCSDITFGSRGYFTYPAIVLASAAMITTCMGLTSIKKIQEKKKKYYMTVFAGLGVTAIVIYLALQPVVKVYTIDNDNHVALTYGYGKVNINGQPVSHYRGTYVVTNNSDHDIYVRDRQYMVTHKSHISAHKGYYTIYNGKNTRFDPDSLQCGVLDPIIATVRPGTAEYVEDDIDFLMTRPPSDYYYTQDSHRVKDNIFHMIYLDTIPN